MRSFAAVAIASTLATGCFSLDGDLDLDLDFGDGCWFGSPCVSSENPVAFTQDEQVLALGGTADVDVLVFTGFQLKLRSSDPSILELEETAPGVFLMRGLAEGAATIEATDGTPNPARIFASHTMAVAPVAKVNFTYRPVGDAPLTRLAGLPDAREAVRVTAVTDNNLPVAGGESVVELSFTGVQKIASTSTEVRFVEFDLFGSRPSFGFDIGVAFGPLGQGSIEARVGGELLGTLPIDVIPSANLVELRPNHHIFPEGAMAVVGLVGFDPQGVPVAGLVGDWSASPADLLDINQPNKRGETFVIGRKPGVVTLTATLPDGRQASRELTIQPAQ